MGNHREAQADQVGVTAIFMARDMVRQHAELLDLTGGLERAGIDGLEAGIDDQPARYLPGRRAVIRLEDARPHRRICSGRGLKHRRRQLD